MGKSVASFLSFLEMAECISEILNLDMNEARDRVRAALLVSDVEVHVLWQGKLDVISSSALRRSHVDFGIATDWCDDVFDRAFSVTASAAASLAQRYREIVSSVDDEIKNIEEVNVCLKRWQSDDCAEGDQREKARLIELHEQRAEAESVARLLSFVCGALSAVADSKDGDRLSVDGVFMEMAIAVDFFCSGKIQDGICIDPSIKHSVMNNFVFPGLRKYLCGFRFSLPDITRALSLTRSSVKMGRKFEYDWSGLLRHLVFYFIDYGLPGTREQFFSICRDYFAREDGGPSDAALRQNVGDVWEMIEAYRKGRTRH